MRWAEIDTHMQNTGTPTDTYDIKQYTPRCILRDALNIVPIHNGGRYYLITLLFCTLLAVASPF